VAKNGPHFLDSYGPIAGVNGAPSCLSVSLYVVCRFPLSSSLIMEFLDVRRCSNCCLGCFPFGDCSQVLLHLCLHSRAAFRPEVGGDFFLFPPFFGRLVSISDIRRVTQGYVLMRTMAVSNPRTRSMRASDFPVRCFYVIFSFVFPHKLFFHTYSLHEPIENTVPSRTSICFTV
jgi:hypothetical protein